MSLALLFIHWNPDPDFIKIGSFAIKWYGVLWGAALMWAFFIEQPIWRRIKWNEDLVTLTIQYIFLGGLVGARLAHILFYDLDYYLANPGQMIAVWKGGLASHGGLVGGLVGLYFFHRAHKQYSYLQLLNISSIAVPLMAALIRFGNLMNSELYGTPTNVPWAFIFQDVDNIPRHPVVLYESIAYTILQVIVLLLFMKYTSTKKALYVAVLFIGLFGTRFFLEFFKVPDGELIFGAISKTQLLNIPFIIAGIWLLMKNKHIGTEKK